ncbi:hypothetical protein ACODT5_02270 [Streptomyces sp. 5.8]|uniref:hypothetical protein n=1 Tax=Streptomyces sp. 5.8 TaxID=3406571 RepID=UPI003BB5A86A
MHHVRTRAIRGAAAAAAILTLTAGIAPAHAEGYFTSSISNFRDGNESRRWTDKNTDGTSTSVSLWNCSDRQRTGSRSGAVIYLLPDSTQLSCLMW